MEIEVQITKPLNLGVIIQSIQSQFRDKLRHIEDSARSHLIETRLSGRSDSSLGRVTGHLADSLIVRAIGNNDFGTLKFSNDVDYGAFWNDNGPPGFHWFDNGVIDTTVFIEQELEKELSEITKAI